MPARSKAQQSASAIALAVKKVVGLLHRFLVLQPRWLGTSRKQLREFARTERSGLPKRVRGRGR